MASNIAQKEKLDPVFIWILLSLAAFLLLPSYGLDYGLFESTSNELWDSYGWSQFLSLDLEGLWEILSWEKFGSASALVWFLLPLPLLIRPRKPPTRNDRERSIFDAFYCCFAACLIFALAWYFNRSFGYSAIILYLSLGAVLTLSLARLDWMGGDIFVVGSIIFIVAIVVLFIVYPTIAIFTPMLYDDNDAFKPLQFLDVLTTPYIRKIIWNSMLLSTAVGISATFFGLICAIYTSRIAVRTAFVGRFFSILPTVTPPFVVGLGATLMMGRSGYVTTFMADWFGLQQTNWLYGFTGIWIAEVLAFSPMSFMLLEGAIKSMSPSVEEASYTLRAGRWQTFLFVFLPLLRPALANSFLIVFVQSLADFSNPIVLGGSYDVLATQIYFFITGSQLNYVSASVLGVILLLFSLLIFAVQYIWIGQRSYVTVSGKSYRGDVQPLPKTLVWGVSVILIFWVIVNTALYGSIIYGSFVKNWGIDYTFTLANYINLFGNGFNSGAWPSLLTTMTYAGIGAPITALIGLLIAYIVVRQNFHGKRTLEFTTMICFAVPGTVAGVSYILAFNTAPVLLTSTAAIVIISMVMRNVPVAVRSGVTGLGQLDKSLDEASLSLRAGTFRTVLYILLPLLRPALLSALVFSFVRAMTTVSAIVFLITPDTRTATAFILARVEDGETGNAIAYGSALIVIMMTIILLFDWLVGEARTSRSKAKQTN